jgi:hypothetical protein
LKYARWADDAQSGYLQQSNISRHHTSAALALQLRKF